ncbi:MAG: hypothetical protein BWX63_02351 [Bacteroidetes bacterium ADurb.Bin041]|nr:MAG: hypothetical protein BWX63_02351 [Bacteroidetes bacterium ADurb.Bin041]
MSLIINDSFQPPHFIAFDKIALLYVHAPTVVNSFFRTYASIWTTLQPKAVYVAHFQYQFSTTNNYSLSIPIFIRSAPPAP